ncbi:hypothetical protein [Nocardia sp. NPDC020380]|uniref:hypothetical protein n=1 Tax=Nocardia sp. NPDC020380 TaxID=3364309 RepID=UPI0037928AED
MHFVSGGDPSLVPETEINGVERLRDIIGELTPKSTTIEGAESTPGPDFGFIPAVVHISELQCTGSLRSTGVDPAHVRRLAEVAGQVRPIVVDRATPWLSDRAVASVAGLSSKTVASIRCAIGEDAQLHERMGVDGRVRPLNAAVGRRLAAQLIEADPTASLRQVAAQAGVSPGTVRDVRARLARGEGPLPPRADQRRPPGAPTAKPCAPVEAVEVMSVLKLLSEDPQLQTDLLGRQLLGWLHQHVVNGVDSTKVAEVVPDHCMDHLVEFAVRCSTNWARLAQALEDRRTSSCGDIRNPPDRVVRRYRSRLDAIEAKSIADHGI